MMTEKSSSFDREREVDYIDTKWTEIIRHKVENRLKEAS
jgi:hypothetical protein